MKPALTTGASQPNHWGLEKWKKTMLMAAKQRKPVSAFSRCWLARLHGLLDDSGQSNECISRHAPEAPALLWPLFPVPCSYAVTSDPTFSPSTTRRMFPGWFMLKMIMGRLLSLHRLTAVRSITFSPWRRISM